MDNLPTTPMSEIEWDFVACWRVLTVAIILLFVFQMAVLMAHYWHRVIPLRRELATKEVEVHVVAPPIVWTFAYHLLVTVTFAVIGVGMAQQVYYEAKPTLFTYAGPILLAALTVVANRFLKYYSDVLSKAQWVDVHR